MEDEQLEGPERPLEEYLEYKGDEHVGPVVQGDSHESIDIIPDEEKEAASVRPPLADNCVLVEPGPLRDSPLEANHESSPAPDSVSSDSYQEDVVPGPVDPERCTASGAAMSGGGAGVPLKLTVVTRDSAGLRIKDGGAYVLVCIEPHPAPPGVEPIEAAVVDNKDGTYTATYTVPTKGSYELSIEVNGEPIGGSPFPIFFSSVVADSQGTTFAGKATVAPPMPAVPAAGPIPIHLQSLSLAHQAAHLGLQFPAYDDDRMARTALIGGISPFSTQESLRTIFALCGSIKGIEFGVPIRQYAFIEFSNDQEAATASRMTGVTLQGQTLRVENALAAQQAAAESLVTKGAQSATPYAALQAYQMMHQQQAALAQQVAQLRAAQKPGVTAGYPGSGADSALAAAAALARRLAAGNGQRVEKTRERDRSRSRDRRERYLGKSGRSDKRSTHERSRSKDRSHTRYRSYRRHRSRSKSPRRRRHERRSEKDPETVQQGEQGSAPLPRGGEERTASVRPQEKGDVGGGDLDDLLRELEEV